MLNKLRNKFLIMCMVVTSLVMMAAFSAVYIITSRNIQAQNELKLSNAILFYRSDTVVVPQEQRQDNGITNISAFVIIYTKNGFLTDLRGFDGMTEKLNETALKTALNNPNNRAVVEIEGRKWVYNVSALQTIQDGGLAVSKTDKQITFLDVTDTTDILNTLLLAFIWVGFSTIAVIFFVSFYFANRSIKPVAAAWEKQRQFIADASHELKTPLAVITSNYDAILANEDETIKSQREWFCYMKSGMDRMAKLINNLLSLAKVESTHITAEHTKFNISAAIENSLQQFGTSLQKKSVSLSLNIERDISLVGDMMLTIQVFEILLENAVKYVDEGGRIGVEVKQEKQCVVCKVGNSGSGIAKEDLSRIFDRFHRTDRSRSDETGGYGLGLSIAKAIAEMLGSEISVKSENDWTEFLIVFERT